MKKVILASTSIYRQKQLKQLNLTFQAVAPMMDEAQVKKQAAVSPTDLPLYLAKKKAESLASLYPQDVIIGSDQMGFLGALALEKPGTQEKAIQQLLKMQGHTHQLHTAVAIYCGGQWLHRVDITELTMRPLNEAQIRNYVDLENPIDCAGSYKFEGLGISLFEKVSTKDPTSIIGLPLISVVSFLTQLGIPVV